MNQVSGHCFHYPPEDEHAGGSPVSGSVIQCIRKSARGISSRC